MNEFTRRTRDKNTMARLQGFSGISYLCMAEVRAARAEGKFRVKSRGPGMP